MNESKVRKIPRGRNGSPPVKAPRIYRGNLLVNLEWLTQHPEVETLKQILKVAKEK